MAITPHTDLYLIKCPLESDNLNQLTFNSSQEQISYFATLPHKVIEDITYQRRDNVIRYPEHIDSIETYNYVMYKNDNYTNKWFFAFITNMRYINDNMTEITIKTDVYQTWQFEMDFKRSFIEREHTSNDTIGANTVPENVELGEYVLNGDPSIIEDFQTWSYIINVTSKPNGEILGPTFIGGVAFAGGFYIFDDSSLTDMINLINEYDVRAEAIVNVYIVPSKLVQGQYGSDHLLINNYGQLTTLSHEIDKPTTIDGYTPKNKKLLTKPYCYLLMSNNNGSNNVLDYERFTTTKAKFEIKGLPTVGGSINCYPLNYKGAQYEEGLIAGKYPTCSWSNDMFTNWLTQNAVNIGLGVGTSVLEFAGGIGMLATGAGAIAGASMMGSGALGIAQSIGQIYQHTFTPPSAKGNINGGDILTSSGLNTFIFYPMSIKSEYAHIIDEYFNIYGYKTNRVKLPNMKTRRNWNYVKTIGANIEGNIPQKDIEELKTIFNTGVTLWHNPATYLDYSQTNSLV